MGARPVTFSSGLFRKSFIQRHTLKHTTIEAQKESFEHTNMCRVQSERIQRGIDMVRHLKIRATKVKIILKKMVDLLLFQLVRGSDSEYGTRCSERFHWYSCHLPWFSWLRPPFSSLIPSPPSPSSLSPHGFWPTLFCSGLHQPQSPECTGIHLHTHIQACIQDC